MARTACLGFWSLGRAGVAYASSVAAARRHSLKACLILIALCFSGAIAGIAGQGEASFFGRQRLSSRFVDAEVIAAGSIVVVRFKRPLDIPFRSLTEACSLLFSVQCGEIRTARRSGCH